jgi:TonB family protein
MSTVYEAHEPNLGRMVALKILPPAFLHEEAFARRFEHEARVIAALEHPNIVPIYASGIDDGLPWLSMRLLSGGSLSDVLSGGPLAADRAVSILRSVARALDYAHMKRVVHRDVKPGNILLDGAGNVCVADFGVARLMKETNALTSTGVIVGTPQYMAPEQALGGTIDHRCDIYSLGVVAFEMFDGAPPFTAPSPLATLMKHVHDPIPRPTHTYVPGAVVDVLHKALAKQPRDRWATASEFVEALAASVRKATKRRSAGRLIAMATAATTIGLLIGCGVIVELWTQVPETPSALAETFRTVPPLPAAPVADPPPGKVGDRQRAETRVGERKIDPPLAPPSATDPSSAATATEGAVQPSTPAAPRPAEPPPTGIGSGEIRADPPKPSDSVPPPPTGDKITKATITHKADAVYPPIAVAGEIQGEVLVEATCEVDGRLTSPNIVRSAHRTLNDAAMTAVRKSKCAPQLRDEVPEASRIRVPVRFDRN